MDLQCQLDMPMIKSKVFDNHSDDRMDEFCKKSIENVKEILNFKQKKSYDCRRIRIILWFKSCLYI